MIKEQFIERDLFNATDLSQIQWRIKGNKLSKEKVVEYLSSKEGREAIKKLGAEKGKVYKDIIGELKIISERAYCPSCQGVIQQFNEMFPNIKLILIDNVK